MSANTAFEEARKSICTALRQILGGEADEDIVQRMGTILHNQAHLHGTSDNDIANRVLTFMEADHYTPG